MGACDTWNIEINILVYENEMFSLPAEFHFNNWLSHIWGFKTEEKYFFDIQIPATKIIEKTAILRILSFCVSPPGYTNWEFMFLMQQPHVQGLG